MKTFFIEYSNSWLITAEDEDAAFAEVQENMQEAIFDKDQFKITED